MFFYCLQRAIGVTVPKASLSSKIGRTPIVLGYNSYSFRFLPMEGIVEDFFEFLDTLFQFASGVVGRYPGFQQKSQRCLGRIEQSSLKVVMGSSVFGK